MRYLKLREDFIKNNNFSNYSLIKEDSGPLANDIAWGDSLLGRLINSVIRKAEIGIDLVKMDSVIQRLKESFELLLSNAKIKGSDTSGEITLKIDKYLMSALLGVLKKAIDEGSDKKDIIKITNGIIEDLKVLQISKESIGDRDDLISKLEEFLKSIETEQTNISGKTKADYLLEIYPKLVENFTSVYKILSQYNTMKREQGQKHLGEKEKEETTTKNIGSPVDKTVSVDKTNDSVYFKLNEQQTLDTGLSKALSSLYSFCKKEFTFQDTTEFYTPIKNSNNKIPISKVYTFIRSKSINEGLTELLTIPESLGEKILNLYNVTKTKVSGDFTGIDDIMKGEIVKFNSSMKEILSFKSKEESDTKTESKLHRYVDFIKEAEETDIPEVEVDKSEKVDFSIPFNKIFSSEYLKKWITTEEEIKSIESEVSKLTKDSTKIVIDGIDPIIEIVKIFNRAYKIHTTSTIPSGRTGGKVSNRTFREYTHIGTGEGGTPANPGSGPWRNNKLFDKWENAVLDIIKDSKYQVLFNEDTEIKVGSADPRINVTKKGEKRVQGGGKTLLTFINGMLDGSKLYKSGAQSKFIEEYFNVEVSADSLGWKGKHGNDAEANAKNADMSKDKKKYAFKSVKDISPDFTKTFYAVIADGKKYYMYLADKDENYIYIKYSESFSPISKYTSGAGIDISKGDMESIQMRERNKDGDKFETFYGRIQRGKFPLKPGTDLELKALNLNEYNISDKKDSVSAKELRWGKINKVHGVIGEENKLFILPIDLSKKVSDKDNTYKEKLK